MSKKAIYYDEAQRLYVKQGFPLTTVEDMLESNISRRQLQNWKVEGDWDNKRRRYLEEQESLGDMVLEICKTTARKALVDPSPKNLLALVRAIGALKEKDALTLFSKTDDGKATDSESKTDIIKLVREALEGQ